MNIVFDEGWNACEVFSSKGKGDYAYFVCIKLKNDSEHREFEFSGSKDIDSLMEIYEASRIEISREQDSQMEFGSYKLCLTAEGYTEIYFDKCVEKT